MVNYDIKNLQQLKTMREHAPDGLKTFQAFSEAATKEGAIPAKYKELIAVAVSVKAQCPYCIELHTNKARQAGATDAELTEASLVAAAIGAGAVMTHSTHALLTGRETTAAASG